MHKVLWGLQVLLMVAMLGAGMTKVTTSKAELAPQMPWVEDFSALQVQLIGVVEVAGGIGVVVPAATGIAPVLTPVAATGLALVMVGAAGTHLVRGEMANVVPPVILMLLCLVVAWGRFGAHPIGAASDADADADSDSDG